MSICKKCYAHRVTQTFKIENDKTTTLRGLEFYDEKNNLINGTPCDECIKWNEVVE